MKIEVMTWFEEIIEPGSGILGCQVAFGYFDSPVMQLPPFITVATNYMDADSGIVYAENTHDFEQPVKADHMNQDSDFKPFGFWRIKYK